MVNMMKQEIRGTNRVEAGVSGGMPRMGDAIRLTKRAVQEGQSSSVSAGETMEGELLSDITLGEQIRFSNGQTSAVQAMRLEGGRVIIETKTSVYELSKI